MDNILDEVWVTHFQLWKAKFAPRLCSSSSLLCCSFQIGEGLNHCITVVCHLHGRNSGTPELFCVERESKHRVVLPIYSLPCLWLSMSKHHCYHWSLLRGAHQEACSIPVPHLFLGLIRCCCLLTCNLLCCCWDNFTVFSLYILKTNTDDCNQFTVANSLGLCVFFSYKLSYKDI